MQREALVTSGHVVNKDTMGSLGPTFMIVLSWYKSIIPEGWTVAGIIVTRKAYNAIGGFQDVLAREDRYFSYDAMLAFPMKVRYVPETVMVTTDRRKVQDYNLAFRGEKEPIRVMYSDGNTVPAF